MTNVAPEPEAPRVIGGWAVVAVVAGSMRGVGIFLAHGVVAGRELPSGFPPAAARPTMRPCREAHGWAVPLSVAERLDRPMATRKLLLVLAALLALAACGKSGPGAGATADGGLPARFSPFTVETLRGLDGLAKVGDPWQPARDRLDARLGMSIYGNGTEQLWAVDAGDRCWMTSLEVEDGKVVAVKPPMELKAADGIAYRHCVAASERNKCFRDGGGPSECIERFPMAQ